MHHSDSFDESAQQSVIYSTLYSFGIFHEAPACQFRHWGYRFWSTRRHFEHFWGIGVDDDFGHGRGWRRSRPLDFAEIYIRQRWKISYCFRARPHRREDVRRLLTYITAWLNSSRCYKHFIYDAEYIRYCHFTYRFQLVFYANVA